ncbi:DUF2235 domain-containing protein [Sedimenticola sp.]|uniref:DUF2235 domain-containing protein n=2 Tax=Sedimenticola sp. TaxID=1940285 RepID=UPI003D0B3A3D
MKYLIVFADGTWNTPDQEDNGVPAPTNVVKLKNCLAQTASKGGHAIEQRIYYHTGVGTEGGILARTAGGAWGAGLDKNIKSAYHWLARNYQPDDHIFLFGFSRGAYTVRSLGGLLAVCGLPDLSDTDVTTGWQRVKVAYQQGYREKKPRTEWAEDWPFHHKKQAPVRFIGVWDTVGALGIPDDLALLNLFDAEEKWRFHNTTLGDNVEMARHAIALDERRASFTPTLWTKIKPDANVVQRWFPGVHSDVGGGYGEAGLSDIALKWMIDEAKGAGLSFESAMVSQIQPNPCAMMHDSMKGLFKTQRSRPRNTPPIPDPNNQIDDSAIQRHQTPPITQAPYRPTRVLAEDDSVTVDIFAREHWNVTGLWLAPGKYQLNGAGEWLDRSIPSGPKGASDGDFHLGELAHIIGSGFGWVEQGLQKLLGNDSADLKFTKRHEQWDWFALIGVVGNSDRKPSSDGSPPPHQTFLIGNQCTLNLKRPGYLYAYANDAWDFYGNNKGSVQLTVKCLSLS